MCENCNELEQARFLNESKGYTSRPSSLPQGNGGRTALDTAADRAIRLEGVIKAQRAEISELRARVNDLTDIIESLVGDEYAPPTFEFTGPAEMFVGYIEIDPRTGDVFLNTSDEVFDETADSDDYESIQDYWNSLGYGTRDDG